MAAETLSETLSSFSTATLAANDALPSFSTDTEAETTRSGISLLSAKNEIFLSYLQVLALRNLHVLRSFRDAQDDDVETPEKDDLEEQLTKKLCELRVYLERGVKPLEGKIEYQIGKVVRAAEEEERAAASSAAAGSKVNGVNGRVNGKRSSSAGDGEDSEEDDSSDEDDDEDEDEEENDNAIPSTAHRANAANFAQPASQSKSSPSTSTSKSTDANKAGIYRPPRISATTMPTTRSDDPSVSEPTKSRRPNRSAVLDDYITTELSSAPQAEPSIGSNIGSASGRSSGKLGQAEKSSRQLAREAERRVYEENNFVRLPKESKKVLAAEKRRQRRDQAGSAAGFGGEEWRGLGDSVDRINAVTARGGEGRGQRGMLERSRKRKIGGEGEGGAGDGGMGDAFERRKRRIMGRKSMRG